MNDNASKLLVQQGYDRIAEQYLAWASKSPSPTRARYLQEVRKRLPSEAHILELGCGAGIPVALDLAQHAAKVVGVDISAAQIMLARHHVPTATFLQADITQLNFPAATFDAVISFYAITHIPRTAHATLFRHIAHWLKPDGIFVASLGASDDPGTVEPDWLGIPMFFSHYDAQTNRNLLQDAGFHLSQDEVVAEEEDGIPVSFQWILAEAPT